jgi:hypothetical protein
MPQFKSDSGYNSESGSMNDLPLFHSLHALRVELLDGSHHAGGTPGRVHGLVVDPALVNLAESALPEHRLRPEVLGGVLEFHKGVDSDVGRVENLALIWR